MANQILKKKNLKSCGGITNISPMQNDSYNQWDSFWDNIDLEKEILANEYNDMAEVFGLYKKYLPKKGRGKTLEAGCGLGAKLLHWHNQGHEIWGIDDVVKCLQRVKKYNATVKVVAADIHNLSFPNNFFKVYLSYGVMEHIKEGPHEALKEAHRVLENNGILVFMVPHDNWITNFNINPDNFIRRLKKAKFIRKIFGKPPLAENQEINREMDEFYIRTVSLQEVRESLKRAGFKIMSICPIYHEHTLYEFIEFFHENDHGKLRPFARSLSKLLKKTVPWFSASHSLTIAKKIES